MTSKAAFTLAMCILFSQVIAVAQTRPAMKRHTITMAWLRAVSGNGKKAN